LLLKISKTSLKRPVFKWLRGLVSRISSIKAIFDKTRWELV
jgi:hypothetical protein